jgi:hypothetical protein
MLIMTKRIILWGLAALILAACSKEVLKPTGKCLAEVTVESDAGQIPVLVTATGVWKARSQADWITVDESWRRDQNTIVLHYGSNRSIEGVHRSDRRGAVLIETADGAECDTLYVHQKGIAL